MGGIAGGLEGRLSLAIWNHHIPARLSSSELIPRQGVDASVVAATLVEGNALPMMAQPLSAQLRTTASSATLHTVALVGNERVRFID